MKWIEDIMGFTFAEIAFLLLYIVLIGHLNSSAFLQKEIVEKDKEIALLQKELRSKQVPSCIESGLHKDFLFTTTIFGENTYRINFKTYSFEGLLKSYKKEMDKANKMECVPCIKVRKLEKVFYIQRLEVQ